jgi:hypothetical protein
MLSVGNEETSSVESTSLFKASRHCLLTHNNSLEDTLRYGLQQEERLPLLRVVVLPSDAMSVPRICLRNVYIENMPPVVVEKLLPVVEEQSRPPLDNNAISSVIS